MAITSTAGFIALLDDRVPEVKTFALQRLIELVDVFWAEISESVSKIEILQEDSTFVNNKLAALLASKVYYHLGEFEDSLHFALCAEELLDINNSSEYIETMLSKCIDKYTSLRIENEKTGNKYPPDALTSNESRLWTYQSGPVYKRMELLVDKMFSRCLDLKQFKQVLGIAIETRRLDMFKKAIVSSEDMELMLKYAFRVVLTLTESVTIRDTLLKVLVDIYTNTSPSDSVNLCQCLVLLNDPTNTAFVLEKLLFQNEESILLAFQIGFDLYENSTQHFLQEVIESLRSSAKLGVIMKYIDKENEKPSKSEETKKEKEADADKSGSEDKVSVLEPLSKENDAMKKHLQHLLDILSGDKVIELHLQLLIRNNKADLKLLERIKDESKNSILHNATILANGILHCGTTSDQFLRDHLSWLGKAVNWAKFTATATLGVIHKGHEKQALKLMSAYLPKDDSGSSGSVYTEGGGLYALGLIHAGHGGNMTEYLLNQCKEATAEPVRHGACLGLGLAAMGTGREDVYDLIKSNLCHDDAITGEAAGIGMGLVMLASGSSKAIEDLVSYAKETAHEKIIRGIALGVALVMYGKQEEADELIDTLVKDNDPILRWCAMATTAMAYCGSGSNKAVRRLLHAAVSDTNDDVRRWALTGIGFILFKNPEQVPSLVSLLAESYHPHLRYGAAMAIGIACAGTAMKDAVSLLDTLTDGTVSFVRQGALVAQAMVLMQQNGITCPKSMEFRDRCVKIISDRHEDVMVKFGAVLARSIIDAGGCNMTISLQTRTGNANMSTAVGLLLFQNYWFWYPLTNFLSMAFTPTAVIALNKELQMPKMQFLSNVKPSAFSYPPALQIEKEKKKEKVETAVLSITAKQKKKEIERKSQQKNVKDKENEKMETDAPKTVKEKEPNFSLLNNPARVMRAQQRVLSLPEDCRYKALKPITQGGFIMVIDKKPEEKEILVEAVSGHGPLVKDSGSADANDAANSVNGSVVGGTNGGGGAAAQSTDGKQGEASDTDNPTNVHGSTLGAFSSPAQENEDEFDEEMDDDVSAEDLDDDEDEDEMEDEEIGIDDDSTTNDTATTGDEDVSAGTNETNMKRNIRSTSHKKKQHAEPTPPDPFQFYSGDESDNREADRSTPTPGKPKQDGSGEGAPKTKDEPDKRTETMDVEDSSNVKEKEKEKEAKK